MLTYCVSGEFQLRYGTEGKYLTQQPLHNGGITVSRADGSCQRVPLDIYRNAWNYEIRIRRIDNMK